MNLKGKKITISYIALAVLIISVIAYQDYIFRDEFPERMNTPFETIFPNVSKTPIVKFSFDSSVEVNINKLFSTFQNIENYPNLIVFSFTILSWM